MRISHFFKPFTLYFRVFLFLFLLNSFGSYGQLTNADISVTVDSTVLQLNDSIQIPGDILHVSISPNDLQDLGTIYINVYTSEGLLAWPEIIVTKEQCVNSGWLEGNNLQIPVMPFSNDLSYRVAVSLTTGTGLFVYTTEIIYPN